MSDAGRSAEGPPGGSGPPGDGGDGGDAPATAEPPANRARRGLFGLAGVLVIYYAAPVGDLPSGGVVFSVLGLLGGTVLLGWSIVRQVQRLMRSPPGDESVRLDSLIFLVILVVPMFAAGYFALEQGDRDQFASLTTKTDSLYFTLSTLATVGFGDVHATGQVARALVTIQITFDLVFVAALVSVVTGQIRERAAQRRAG
jgi:hypothetical protein